MEVKDELEVPPQRNGYSRMSEENLVEHHGDLGGFQWRSKRPHPLPVTLRAREPEGDGNDTSAWSASSAASYSHGDTEADRGECQIAAEVAEVTEAQRLHP